MHGRIPDDQPFIAFIAARENSRDDKHRVLVKITMDVDAHTPDRDGWHQTLYSALNMQEQACAQQAMIDHVLSAVLHEYRRKHHTRPEPELHGEAAQFGQGYSNPHGDMNGDHFYVALDIPQGEKTRVNRILDDMIRGQMTFFSRDKEIHCV